ncbi:metal ABC transporter solute-binding protein, Zn/Mn family [Limosilactobacillus reuteri]|uniref:metal ABC transporter solute-binding protein, Zn/Mn family n=1 Tax=Limosilactobacillus reuteri TaxID=1598 RepID=UPI0015C5C895|nr:zinc ABC transporter substrate-binding protein [Limosilactobacillus reuteri]
MTKLANKLAKDYGKIDPQNADYYHQNVKKYITSLDQLDQKIAQVKSQVNPQKKEAAVSEPVFDYALENLGYKVMDQHFEKAIEEGTDPSPKDIPQIQTAIKNHQIAFFVDNTQASDHVVDNLVKLAKKNHVPVLRVTETKPSRKMTYTEWMMKQYQKLSSIQQQ